MFSVCVFLGSMCLKLLLRDDFENLKYWLDPWLSCMFDWIHICVFHFSTSSSCNLDSFSTAGGLIKLLFSFLVIYPSTNPRQLHFSTPFCLTPLDTSIYRDLLGSYLSVNCDFPLIFLELSLDKLVFSPPKTLSLTPSLFPGNFQAFSSFFLHLVSFFSLIYMHFMFWNLGFGIFEKFWGFSKLMSFCWNFGMGFCLNKFKISCIALHKHYNSIIMHLDVFKLIVCW